jgi:hypothetical protein
MRYTVLWQPTAEAALATLWTTAPDRHAVAAAADHIDAQLQRDPHSFGESRSGMRRIGIELPLGVDFEIREDDRQVLVLRVWRV